MEHLLKHPQNKEIRLIWAVSQISLNCRNEMRSMSGAMITNHMRRALEKRHLLAPNKIIGVIVCEGE